MVQFYYTTAYHPDGYMVGRIFFVFECRDSIYLKTFHDWNPKVVHDRCQSYIMEREV